MTTATHYPNLAVLADSPNGMDYSRSTTYADLVAEAGAVLDEIERLRNVIVGLVTHTATIGSVTL